MLSFTPYIFGVIAEGGNYRPIHHSLYVLFCRDRLEIKRRMALIVNKSDTRTARVFLVKGEIRHTVHAASLMLLQPLQEALIFKQMMTVNKRPLYEIVHISAEVCLLS